jgi:hypothetical protein
MRNLLSAFIVLTMTLATPVTVLAGGAYVPKPPVKTSEPWISQDTGFLGCGGKRVRDPKTQECRGPADFPY